MANKLKTHADISHLENHVNIIHEEMTETKNFLLTNIHKCKTFNELKQLIAQANGLFYIPKKDRTDPRDDLFREFIPNDNFFNKTTNLNKR